MNSFTKIRRPMLKVSAFTVLAAAQLLPSGVAHGEGNYIAGAMCVPTVGGTVAYNNYAEIINAGSTTMHVVCPTDRSNFGPLDQTWALVNVTDNNTSSDVVCAINSKDPHTPAVTWQNASLSGTGAYLNFTWFTRHITPWDYTWVSCDLPPVQSRAQSKLQSFATYEK